MLPQSGHLKRLMTRLEEKPSKFAKTNPCFQTRKALHFGHFFGRGHGNFSFNLKICLSDASTKIIIFKLFGGTLCPVFRRLTHCEWVAAISIIKKFSKKFFYFDNLDEFVNLFRKISGNLVLSSAIIYNCPFFL